MVLLVLFGIVAVNVLKHLQGPQYQATAQVQIATTPLSSIITGTQPAFIDPQRIQDTAQTLAGSPQVFELARRQTGGRFGSAGSLQSSISVSGVANTDILSFSATSSSPARAIGVANGVADAYVAYRGQLSNAAISQTLSKLEATLAALPAGSTQRTQVEGDINRMRVLQGVSSSDAQVVERATSAAKTSPAPVKDSILGFSLGLVIALIVVAVREAVDTTVRSESDVEDLLSAPVLATVRPLPRRARIVTYGRHEAMFGDTYALLAAQLTPKAGKESLVLAITSALAREGKTTTAANLAVAAARRGSDVLLADFDFRKSTLSDLFDVPDHASGALQVVDHPESVESVLWSVALDGQRPIVSQNGIELREPFPGPAQPSVAPPNGNPGETTGLLHILPSGGVASTHAGQSRLGPLIRELRSRADLVILDTPPALLTVEMTELANLIDLVLVVVRQGHVSQRNLRSLGRRARGWRAELAGAVMTDVPSVAGEYGGPYYGSASR